MVSLVYVCLILVVAASAAPESRIAGGVPVAIADHPYVVAYTYYYPGIGITIQRCVGVLISSWHSLTSGYCYDGAILSNIQVRAGSTNSLVGGTLVNVREFVRPPGYTDVPRGNDIAVTFLQTALGITNSINYCTFHRKTCTSLMESGPQLGTLKTVLLNKINIDICQAAYNDIENVAITDNVICATAPSQGVCFGDSGAPLVMDNIVVGISSFNQGCGIDEYPDVFSRVDSNTNWILDVATAGRSGSGIRVAPSTK